MQDLYLTPRPVNTPPNPNAFGMATSQLALGESHNACSTNYGQDDIETNAPTMPSCEELRQVLSKQLAYALTASLV